MQQDNSQPEKESKEPSDKFRKILSSQNEDTGIPEDFDLPEEIRYPARIH